MVILPLRFETSQPKSISIKKICVTCTKLSLSFVTYKSCLVSLAFLLVIFNCVELLDFNTNRKLLDSCERCQIVVDSFKEGLKRTARGKHDGGDAHWEESKLSNYANSEIRLTEIQESLCEEVTTGQDQCHSFAEEYEEILENWFVNVRSKNIQEGKEEDDTLFEYLCNEKAKVCCPKGHFGPNCQPCPGYPDHVCYNRGYCSGNGTRQGIGKCVCYPGFEGSTCEKCAPNYLASGQTELTIGEKTVQLPESCTKCDTACSSTCHSLGPRGCHVCRKGYIWDNDTGCIDIDECLSVETNPCKDNTYCINTLGSYKCYQCHRACDGCIAGGSDSCVNCSTNYRKVGSQCVEPSQHWLTEMLSTRYITYLGLIATILVIARTSIPLSACLALATTIYIALIEHAHSEKTT